MNKLGPLRNSSGFVSGREYSTYVRVIGHGPPLIIIHGGPGLEHSYLFEWLKPLAELRTLIFYDQLGCGQDKSPLSAVSGEEMIGQLAELIEELELDSSVGIFAHSWGTYIVLSFLHENQSEVCSELIVSNPMATTLERFEQSGQRLISRVPEDVLSELGSKSGADVMQALLPYYVASPSNIPPVQFSSYCEDVYDKVINSVGSFDLREASQELPDKTLLIYGEQDFEIQSGSEELIDHAKVVETIPGAGHFSFAENPERFMAVVKRFFRQQSH